MKRGYYRKQNWENLEKALNSGDIDSARQAFAAIQQDMQKVQKGGESGPNQVEQDMQKVQDALSAGDITAPQQAFSTIQQHRAPNGLKSDGIDFHENASFGGHADRFFPGGVGFWLLGRSPRFAATAVANMLTVATTPIFIDRVDLNRSSGTFMSELPISGGAVKSERVVTNAQHQQLLSGTGTSRLQTFEGAVPSQRRDE